MNGYLYLNNHQNRLTKKYAIYTTGIIIFLGYYLNNYLNEK